MDTLDSLPPVPKGIIKEMQKIAEEKFGVTDDTLPEPIKKHPMLYEAHEEQSKVEESVEQVQYVAQQEDPEQVEEIEEVVVPETRNQANIRELREKAARAERAERERDELMRHILAQQQAQPVKKIEPVEVEHDVFAELGLDNDSLVEAKHIKALLKQQEQKFEKKMQQYTQRTNQDTVEVKVKSQYPDFDKVVSQDNLQSLQKANPILSKAILATPDIYEQAKLAYEMIRQYGIYKDDTYIQEKAIAQKNAAKPRPLTSVSPQQGNSPMSKANAFANGLTPDLKAQLLKEMNAHRKQGY